MNLVRRIAAPATILVAFSGSALAHTGHGDSGGLLPGFLHPLGGLDHVVAMVAVGLYASMAAGRALWLVPGAFITVMALGGALGMAGYVLPYTEIGIPLSMTVLGLAVALRISVPTLGAVALAGLFAIFHGHAHGAEMPQGLSGYEYAAGFMLATALLHGVGLLLGLVAGMLATRGGWRAAQVAGGAMALAGVALLVSAV